MKQLSTQAQVAKSIKSELRKLFPDVRFLVTSEIYSGCTSVHVRWEDGPTEKQVREHMRKYESATFDAKTDSYEHKKNRQSPLMVEFVCLSRNK